jgi:hypothetical protein
MSSLSFDKETVCTLMSLVDDHKEDLNEASYIQICNIMKAVHDALCDQERNRLTTQEPQPGDHQQIIRTRINIMRREINAIEDRMRITGRVTLTDKIETLRHLMEVHSIGIDSAYDQRLRQMNKNSAIKAMEGIIGVVMRMRDLPKIYRERRDVRKERERTELGERRQYLLTEIGRLMEEL